MSDSFKRGMLVDQDELRLLLRTRRKYYKLTQQDVSNVIGKNRTSVANYEAGNQRFSLETIAKYAEALGLTMKIYLERDE